MLYNNVPNCRDPSSYQLYIYGTEYFFSFETVSGLSYTAKKIVITSVKKHLMEFSIHDFDKPKNIFL